MILQVKNINKSFSGKQILHDVTFDIKSGRTLGFLGRNGAGKTTTIRMLMDVFRPDSGHFLIDGRPFSRAEFKIGYLPEERGLYGKIGIIEQLSYLGRLKGMGKKQAKKAAIYWLEYMGLKEHGDDNLETLSKGNQQKVQIIQAIINDPDILILDEPFSGLDPINAQLLKKLINKYAKEKRIVIFSSHQMNIVEEFCKDVVFIRRGHIVLDEDLESLKRTLSEGKVRLKASNYTDTNLLNLLKDKLDTELSKDEKSIIIKTSKDIGNKDILRLILENNIEMESFFRYEPSLEEIFLLVENKEQDHFYKGI